MEMISDEAFARIYLFSDGREGSVDISSLRETMDCGFYDLSAAADFDE